METKYLFICLCLAVGSCESKTVQKRQTTEESEIGSLFDAIGGRREVDFIIAMDRSKSMSEEVFYLKVRKLSEAILKQYATLDFEYVRLAVISFAVNSTVVFDYISNADVSKTKCELFYDENSKWEDILYTVGRPQTNIKAAFEDSLAIFNKGKDQRPNVAQYLLLISDGKWDDSNDPTEAARQLKEGAGVTIYAAGVGVWLEIGNVQILTTKPAYYDHYDQWREAVTTGDSLTSYSTDLRPTWTQIYTCEDCGDNAKCYCDIDRGFQQCLCDPGYCLNDTDDSCIPCPSGTYKEAIGNDLTGTPCPFNMTSAAGTNDRSECECIIPNGCTDDPCEQPTACNANQLCVADDATRYHCECLDGWSGDDCSVNVDECAAFTSPCPSGSTCVDGLGTGVYACVCNTWGYGGRFCEVDQDECTPGLCKNNATCADRVNNFQCECVDDFVGRYCQDTAQAPTTTLRTPSAGPVVSSTTTTPSSTPNVTSTPVEDDTTLWIIIGASAGGAVLLLVIIIVAVVCCRRKKAEEKEEVKNIAHQFSGFWKKKTVRGNKWRDEEMEEDGGLPSAPSDHRPDLLSNTNGAVYNSVENLKTDEYTELPYQTMTLKTGMESWQNYMTELEDSHVITSGLLVKTTDGDKMARTSGWLYDQAEVDRLKEVMDDREVNVPVRVQDGEYHVTENDGTLAIGRTIGDSQEPLSICIGRTKAYVVVCIASAAESRDVKQTKEVQWMVDHISGEGY